MAYNQTVGRFFLPADGFDLPEAAFYSFLGENIENDYTARLSDRQFPAGSRQPPCSPGFTWAANVGVEIPGKAGMIVRSARFLDLEMPPEFFDSWITPVPHFFVRNHMHEPSTWDADRWKLSIGGEVENSAQCKSGRLGESGAAHS